MNQRRLKVLLLSANTAPIPDVLGGGAERLVTMLLEQNESKHRAEFIVTSPYNQSAYLESKKFQYTKFIFVKRNNVWDKLWNIAIYILNHYAKTKTFLKKGYYSKILNITQNIDIDIIIDENGYVPEIQYFKRNYGKEKILAHVHWQVNPQKRNIDGIYGGIIGVSQFITDSWAANSRDSTLTKMTVYSGVDEKRFHCVIDKTASSLLREKYGIHMNETVFLYCGRLSEQKGAQELIEAFKLIHYNEVKLIIIGSSYLSNSNASEYERELWKTASEDDRIIFTGYIDNKDLTAFYRLADVQVIPTLIEEAAGLVAIEGMLSGLPIIATKSGGLPEYVSEDCAILVEKDANIVQNLKSAMETLAVDRELRQKLSINALARGRLYSQEQYYDNFVNQIESYIANKT